MYDKAFWRAALERALFTFAQAFLSTPAGLALLNVVVDFGDGELDLVLLHKVGLLVAIAVIVALIAGGLSILSSLVKARKDGNPSLGNAEVVPQPRRAEVA